MSIFVGNLPYEVDEQDLNDAFSEYGSVRQIHLPTDRDTGRMRGFGFVHMETLTQEQEAITALDGAEWHGRTIKVNTAKPRENQGSSGRHKTWR